MSFHQFEWSVVRALAPPVDARILQETTCSQVSSAEGILELPGIFSTAHSWVLHNEYWPDKRDGECVELHLAVSADHCYEWADDQTGEPVSVGVFAGTLYARQPGVLDWMRPNAFTSPGYSGLMWRVTPETLASQISLIRASVGNLSS